MGKETGFLEYERKDRTYADPKERVRHYKEFVKPHAEPDLRLQAARLGPLPHQGFEVLPRGGLQHGPGHGVARVGVRELPGADHGRQRQQPA